MRAFSIRDPLPQGTTLLEASAGTGKTWTVGALVARYVAEGVAALDELLIITFGRAASRELRERVREQLVEAERELGSPEAVHHRNEVIALLADGTPEVVAERRERLRAALADFDGATIATTHQFCQLVLRSLGTAGDADANAELVESLDDVLVQVVDDLYLERFRNSSPPPFTIGAALELARSVVGDPQARLLPGDADPSTLAGARVGFALAVRDELDRRKRSLGLLGYDDLLSRLAVALDGDDAPARDQMRRRWKVVLVDEFQDTDPIQWQVLERAFEGHASLILIGDPKQAIYAFRGGDVVTYLEAAGTAAEQATLSTNWRSDAPLVASLLVPFEGAALGDGRIVVHPVEAAKKESRLTGTSPTDPFRLRVLTRYDSGVPANGKLAAPRSRDLIAEDLAVDITTALAGGTRFDGRPLEAGDIAVLVMSHAHAAHVQRVLGEHGVAAVLAGGTNVFRSAAGDAWLTLLEAMERPQSSPRVRAAALTDFMGHTAADLATSGDALTDGVATRVRELADLLRDRGIAAVFEATSGHGELARRVLQRADGRRRMTDLRHIAQALHEAAEADRLGPAAMLAWLRAQRDDSSVGTQERTRRLDSDAAAVQIVTVHASKGLQYPIVHLPFLFDRWIPPVDVPRLHAGTDRVLDIGGPGSESFMASEKAAKAEDCAEQLRLLYVAATRAQSQVVAWWAPTTNAHHSGLTRLLFGRRPGEPVVPDIVPAPSDEEVVARLTQWQELGGPVVERVLPRDRTPLTVADAEGELAIRTFDRVVDATWRRTSYTGLTRDDHAAPMVGSEAPEVGTTDEETEEFLAPASSGIEVLSPMAGLPTGTDFGSLVHGVLERLELPADDLRAVLLEQVERERAYWGVDADPGELADALVAVCRTPLGPLADDLTLETLLASRQLRELDFELPLAGGDTADARAAADEPRLGDIAPLLEEHLPADDPMRAFADRLRSPGLAGQGLRGYLSGSIDLGLRLPDGRVLVVDYKTNWLGDFREPLTLGGYSPAGLADAMNSGTYPLQALLYSVVMHRFLRWRQPGYDPSVHLGGILYLYVRGMAGPDTPRDGEHPYGVFAWHPPASLVEALSDLMDGATV